MTNLQRTFCMVAAVVASVACAAREQCTQDREFPGCICRGNGFVLDVSEVLPYPVTLESKSGSFFYSFSPCIPIACSATASAMCRIDAGSNRIDNLGLEPSWTVHSVVPQVFSVKYSIENRQTIATFFEYSYAARSFVSDVQARPDNTTYVFFVTFNATKPNSLRPVASLRLSGGFIAVIAVAGVLGACLVATCIVVAVLGTCWRREKRRTAAVPHPPGPPLTNNGTNIVTDENVAYYHAEEHRVSGNVPSASQSGYYVMNLQQRESYT